MDPSVRSPFLAVPKGEWIASNELAFAILDRFPVTPGHALVVPRRLIEGWWDATEDEQRAIFDLVGVIRRRLETERMAKGFNVGFNSGAVAGQTVLHLHVHVIPRYEGDVPDPRGGIRWVIPRKANYLDDGAAGIPSSALLPGGDDRLLRRLRGLFADRRFDRIDLVVSFVMRSGVEELADAFETARGRGARIRVLTTDYLGVTEVGALARLLDWIEDAPDRLQVRVFQSGQTSFHPKSYVFWSDSDGSAQGIVGSSNLSRSGLAGGIEWNLAVGSVGDLVREYEVLWNDARSVPLTHEWLDGYRPRSRAAIQAGEFLVVREPVEEVKPNSVQREVLEALAKARARGERHGLVVMATGLGKTFVAAFDSLHFERVLFVAHRDEILRQSRDAFRRIRPEAEFGMFHGEERAPAADVVFASVQTLVRRLSEFAPEAFDYVVVDEFHHAAASSYRQVIDHFRPRFMLGLTATPERMDGQNLLDICGSGEEPLFECNLVDGIRRELLCPFEYFGINDSVDFAPIPWRNGKFDPESLKRAVETQSRADHALREWRSHAKRRTLAFCCTVTHADFMARHFVDAGVRAVAVHSEVSSAPRAESIEALKAGRLDVVFSVDVFNEGLDVPSVDTVLMLRPSESPVVFLQQLGRGLRRDQPGKVLRVIDFIGNHRSFFLKPRTLLSLGASTTPSASATLKAMQSGEFGLPPGCSVDYDLDLVDVFRRLVKVGAQDELADWCREKYSETGGRPSADQAFRAGLDPGGVRKRNRSAGWFDFLSELDIEPDVAGSERMLGAAERRALLAGGEFLRALEVEPLTKCLKLVTLKALLADGAFLSGATVAQVAATARALVLRDLRLKLDVSSNGGPDPSTISDDAWVRYWRKNPISAWIGDASAKSKLFFILDGDRLVPRFEVPRDHSDAFCGMVSELVEWRLLEYLWNRRPLASPGIVCKVSQSAGSPLVRFPDRGRPLLPSGAVKFRADGETYEGDFQKSGLQMAHFGDSPGNALHALLRRWFGPVAGHAGTSHAVILEFVDGAWVMRPDAEAASSASTLGSIVPLFPNYAVACGAFDQPQPTMITTLRRSILPITGLPPPEPGDFIVFARGDSMDGGADPIRHGDPLLLRWARGVTRRDLLDRVVLVRHGEAANAPTVLKRLRTDRRGGFVLASDRERDGPGEIAATASDRIIARLVRRLRQAELNPLSKELERQYRREDVPALYGASYSPGNWNAGHVSLDERTVLLVTLNKSAMEQGGEYHDQFESVDRLSWTSQNSTTRAGKRGRELLECLDTGREIHLWVRGRKSDRAFTYCGLVVPLAAEGDQPIRITWRLLDPLSELSSLHRDRR